MTNQADHLFWQHQNEVWNSGTPADGGTLGEWLISPGFEINNSAHNLTSALTTDRSKAQPTLTASAQNCPLLVGSSVPAALGDHPTDDFPL